jgi:catalase
MASVPRDVVDRQLALFDKIDASYGDGVREELGKTPPVSETVLP